MDRPGFRQLIRDMETGQVDTLVAWRLDRLGRTAKGLTSLFDDLIRWKVNLISLKDGLDLVTPSGRLMATILAGVAAYETEVRAERILYTRALARPKSAKGELESIRTGAGDKSRASRWIATGTRVYLGRPAMAIGKGGKNADVYRRH